MHLLCEVSTRVLGMMCVMTRVPRNAILSIARFFQVWASVGSSFVLAIVWAFPLVCVLLFWIFYVCFWAFKPF